LAALASAEEEIRSQRIFGPETRTGIYKHPASFEELQNGDLYLVFFSGQGEYNDDTAAVFGARLKRGGNRWSKPVAIARNPFHSLGNAVVWQGPDGMVWLFYVTRYGDTWARSRITAKVSRYGDTWARSRITAKVSRDGAHTWSEPFMLTFEPGTMVRAHPIVLSNGDYLLPIYHEVGEDTELVGPDCTSLFLRYEPKARRWSGTNRVRSRLGNIQPAVVQLDEQRLLAFSRRGGDYHGRPDGWLVRTESHDGGRTWSEGRDSEFPNPNAAVDFIKLRNGHLLLVYNHSFTNRTPLTVAISTDGARSFPHKRNIAQGEGDFAYPTAVQTRDGRIHVVFTSDDRTVIRRVVFKETAIVGRARPQ
jgi:predicted neuraminidase